VRAVHRGDKNRRFAAYEEIIHLDKFVLYGFCVQIMQWSWIHSYFQKSFQF